MRGFDKTHFFFLSSASLQSSRFKNLYLLTAFFPLTIFALESSTKFASSPSDKFL